MNMIYLHSGRRLIMRCGRLSPAVFLSTVKTCVAPLGSLDSTAGYLVTLNHFKLLFKIYIYNQNIYFLACCYLCVRFL